MKKLLKKACIILAIGLSLSDAKEVKTLYDLYRIEREKINLSPKIYYIDEIVPEDFQEFAKINKDYRDCIDLMFDFMNNCTVEEKKNLLNSKEVWFIFGCIFTKIILTI